MLTEINYQDPTFYEEENALLTHRREAEMSFDIILDLININQYHSFENNKQVDELLRFKCHIFNKRAIQNGLISFLYDAGDRSKIVLDVIEKKQYNLGFTDNPSFNLNYERVRVYLDYIIASCNKVKELHRAYHLNLKFLFN